jgi:hypothetical protein
LNSINMSESILCSLRRYSGEVARERFYFPIFIILVKFGNIFKIYYFQLSMSARFGPPTGLGLGAESLL